MMDNTNLSTFSVIIPASHSTTTLLSCLTAIAQSSLRADEIIVVDCGTPDRTEDIARHYGARFIALPGKGKGSARNEGLKVSMGGIVFGSFVLTVEEML